MNLRTARSTKQATEAAIAAALQDFTETTGLRVDRLNVEAVLNMGKAPTGYYVVNLEARL